MRGKLLFGAASAALLMAAAPFAYAQEADQPGDATTQARIAPGQAIDAQLDADDIDWFRLAAEPGQRYRISVDAAAAPEGARAIDPILVVYGANGEQLAYNDDAGGTLNSALYYAPTQAGDVFLEVRAYNPQIAGGYRIAVEAAPLPADDVANDSSTRTRIQAGRTVQGALEYEGDVDWYRLDARAGNIYRIALNGGQDGGQLRDPFLRVVGADGAELAINDDWEGLNSFVEFTPAQNGAVFVVAGAYADAYAGTYTLSVESARQPRDSIGANTRTNGRINIGASVTDTIDYQGDRDWRRVRLTAGQTYRFALNAAEGENPLGDPLLRLYDSAGTELAADDDGGGNLNSLLEFTAPTTGNYFIEAAAFADYSTGAYTLRALAGDIPGDASTDATLSAEGDYREGIINPANDRDWYRVDLEAGQSLRIGLMTDQGAGALDDPLLVVYGPDSSEVARDDDSGGDLNAWLEYQATVSGPHYLEARAYGDGIGRYAISIVGGEIGDTAESAEFLMPNTQRASVINSDGDSDWFAVDLIEGRPYRFTLVGDGDNALADPFLTLHNMEGAVIAADDDGGPGLGAQISFTPIESGIYFLAAASFNGVGVGRYMLRMADTEVPGHIYTDEYLDADNDARRSRIDMPGDLDYFGVELEGGVTYQIDVEAAGDYPLADPYLVITDDSNNRLTADDDSGRGLDARVRFTPQNAGTYFIQVSGVGGGVGTYQVSIARR